MPAFRNLAPNRISGRLGKHIPVIYDKEGWPVPESVNTLACHSIKHEPVEVSIPQSASPLSSSYFTSTPYVAADVTPHRPEKHHQLSPLCIPSEASLFAPTLAESSLPARRNSHIRRRDPGHIPRPRNAFIFFRSHFIATASASGEGQQNELSKHAGKVWNKMSPEERRPFTDLAAAEKVEHAILHPNYIYAPGRGSTKSKAKASTRRGGASSGSSQKKGKAAQEKCSRSFATSSEPESPKNLTLPPRDARAPRAAAQRAVQRIVHFPSSTPSPRLSPTSDEYLMMMQDNFNMFSMTPEADFVPTADIPTLELTPSPCSEQEATIKIPEPTFYVPELPTSVEGTQEQFGFKPYLPPAAINASLPPLPNFATDSPFSYGYNRIFSTPRLSVIAPTSAPYPTSVLPLLASSVPKNELQASFLTGSEFTTPSLLFGDTVNGHATSSFFPNMYGAYPGMVSEHDVSCMEEYFGFTAYA